MSNTRPPFDTQARCLEESLSAALTRVRDYRAASEDQDPSRQGPGSIASEWEALRKALLIVIRDSGPFLL